jgi:hypothetical protein
MTDKITHEESLISAISSLNRANKIAKILHNQKLTLTNKIPPLDTEIKENEILISEFKSKVYQLLNTKI